MNTKQDFVNIGAALFAVDQVMSIGVLDDLKSIEVVFKNPSFDPMVINFQTEETAEACFDKAKEALCNTWS